MSPHSKTTARIRRPPKGWRTGHDGDLACPHRDVSVCADCARLHVEVIEIYGQHFWIASEAERAVLENEGISS